MVANVNVIHQEEKESCNMTTKELVEFFGLKTDSKLGTILKELRESNTIEYEEIKARRKKYFTYKVSIEILELIKEKIKPKEKRQGKRIHNKIPIYKKVYSVYAYDQQKYHDIYYRIHSLALKYGEHIYNRVNPYRVLALCYERDEMGNLKRLGDEPHIFRIKAFENIRNLIAKEIIIKRGFGKDEETMEYIHRKTGLMLYPYSEQAEMTEYVNDSLYKRLKIHIEILRNLRKGLEIEESIINAKNKYSKVIENKKVINFNEYKHYQSEEHTGMTSTDNKEPICNDIKEIYIKTLLEIKNKCLENRPYVYYCEETNEYKHLTDKDGTTILTYDKDGAFEVIARLEKLLEIA